MTLIKSPALVFYFIYTFGGGSVVQFAKLYRTLCEPMDCSPPGSSVHGILQTRIVEWVAIPFSRGSSRPRDQTQVYCIAGRFFTIWATREAPTITERLEKRTEERYKHYLKMKDFPFES